MLTLPVYLYVDSLHELVLRAHMGVEGVPVALVGNVAAEAGSFKAVVVDLNTRVAHSLAGGIVLGNTVD